MTAMLDGTGLECGLVKVAGQGRASGRHEVVVPSLHFILSTMEKWL